MRIWQPIGIRDISSLITFGSTYDHPSFTAGPGGENLQNELWGAKMFEPADGTFWEAVRQEDPELLKS